MDLETLAEYKKDSISKLRGAMQVLVSLGLVREVSLSGRNRYETRYRALRQEDEMRLADLGKLEPAQTSGETSV